ncbi:hypothetical protein SELMODRAFT_420557 [Selaginella moellendorffii]|uniref:Uncharacterized protein n=1 Tax=Selaginella moellendorffii TaxID=88036 RepID=D8SCD6_SELML|nr:hypothetical protein SELMODRAFT_420557 [Selaginella moellendorffii]
MTSFVTFILVAVISSVCNAQDLSFTATTPGLTKGKPNTFIGTTGDEIASSLLASKTPAMLWGSVPASAITNVCQKISQTGRQEYTAKIDGDWGGSEDLKLKVTNSSGTQFVFTDNYGRKSAIVCPSNAGGSGCGVYMTGSDVDSIYNKRLELVCSSQTLPAIRQIRQLEDSCLVGTLKNGRLDFSEIYAFGHRDRRVTSSTWNYPTQRPLSSRACISCQRCSKLATLQRCRCNVLPGPHQVREK